MKSMLKAIGIGASMGLAANQIVSYAVSAVLRLGYYMPYPATLPERLGGEMKAVAAQMIASALLGAGFAAAWHIGHHPRWKVRTRVIGAAASVMASVSPILLITTGLLG